MKFQTFSAVFFDQELPSRELSCGLAARNVRAVAAMKAHKTARLGLSGCRGRGSAGLFLIRELVKVQIVISYTLWLFNIAMEMVHL